MYYPSKKKYKSFIFFFLIAFEAILTAQNLNDEILARIGENVILRKEFENRLNYYPREGIQDKNNNSGIKKELLYSLIAEKLWVNYALQIGFDNNISVITAKNVIEKMFVRDQLYNEEIKSKILINNEEHTSAGKRYNQIYDCVVFHSLAADSLKKAVASLVPLNSSLDLTKIKNNGQINFKELKISYGDLPLEAENLLYSLKKNEFSAPIKLEYGWNIFYVRNIEKREYKDAEERLKGDERISKILSSRKEDSRYNEFHKEFFDGKQVDVDGKLFDTTAKLLKELFSEKYLNGIFFKNKDGEEVIQLDSEDLRVLEKRMDREILSQPFIKFDNDPIPLITFLREISFQSFSVSSANYEVIKVAMNDKIKEYIKYELLAREGFRRGLNEFPSVKYWVKIWYENFLYQAIRNNELNNIDNSDRIDSEVSSNEKLDQINEKPQSAYKKFVERTISLSDEFEIEIDQNMFNSIEQSNINLFVLRNLGFGGQIAGVPASPIFIDWYLEKRKRELQNL